MGGATVEDLITALVDACVVACEASATVCGAHADHHDHCRLHAASAQTCADALHALQKALPG